MIYLVYNIFKDKTLGLKEFVLEIKYRKFAFLGDQTWNGLEMKVKMFSELA